LRFVEVRGMRPVLSYTISFATEHFTEPPGCYIAPSEMSACNHVQVHLSSDSGLQQPQYSCSFLVPQADYHAFYTMSSRVPKNSLDNYASLLPADKLGQSL
jgi:hypothetical protein